jgi:AraC-like DNA-binding protein
MSHNIYKRGGMMSLEVILTPTQVSELAERIVDSVLQGLKINGSRRLSIDDAARELGVSRSTLQRAIKDGMPVLRPTPRKVIVDLDLATQWMNKAKSEF